MVAVRVTGECQRFVLCLRSACWSVTRVSRVSRVSCARTVPGAPPQNVRIDARDSQTLRVTWQAPPANQQNGDIIGYKVHFAPDASNVGVNEAQVIDVTDAEQRATDIGGLGKFTSYKIWVLAYTVKGDGPTSPLQVARTDEDGKPGRRRRGAQVT